LEDSNWNNLRLQDRRLRDELADIDTRYAQAKEDINTANAALEVSLVNILEGQVNIAKTVEILILSFIDEINWKISILVTCTAHLKESLFSIWQIF
jgi:hypothetical protein